MKWLIWSNEHGRWWAPKQNGYTVRIEDAGRYDFDEAVEIVKSANESLTGVGGPDETMCPEWSPR